MKNEQIEWKDLSVWIKAPLVMAWIVGILSILAFIQGFLSV